MRDFDYDVWQKKILARNATHKKNGSKSKKCTLPSDHLTEAQKRQLNGKVYTMNRNKPMTWEAFKALPQSLAQEYVRFLQESFDARVGNIAQMFGVSTAAFKTHCEKHAIAYTPRKGHLQAEKKKAWDTFLDRNETEPAAGRVEPMAETNPEPVDTWPVEATRMTVNATGEVFFLAEYLKTLPLKGRYHLTVELVKTEETP